MKTSHSELKKPEVVQDFANGTNPRIYTAFDSNVKFGVEGVQGHAYTSGAGFPPPTVLDKGCFVQLKANHKIKQRSLYDSAVFFNMNANTT